MKINWTGVVSTVVAVIIIGGAWMLLTKRKINMETGAIETKMTGFEG